MKRLYDIIGIVAMIATPLAAATLLAMRALSFTWLLRRRIFNERRLSRRPMAVAP